MFTNCAGISIIHNITSFLKKAFLIYHHKKKVIEIDFKEDMIEGLLQVNCIAWLMVEYQICFLDRSVLDRSFSSNVWKLYCWLKTSTSIWQR